MNIHILSLYANPPSNYIGAALFSTYVVSAVWLTVSISRALYGGYARIPAESPRGVKLTEKENVAEKHARRRHIKIYAVLAALSFAKMAYTMLRFLFSEFSTWAESRGLDGSGGGLRDVRAWLLESALFEGFAREVVGRGSAVVWMQGAVLGIWFWGGWMGWKAEQRGFSTRIMAPYIALTQILPVTLPVCFFIIHLHLDALGLSPHSPSQLPILNHQSKKQKEKDKEKEKKENKANPKKSSPLPPILLLNALLLALPPLSHPSPLLTPLLLLARFLVLLPFTSRLRHRETDILQSLAISGGFVVANAVMGSRVVRVRDVLAEIGEGGWAVRTLGWDVGMGGVVWGVLRWGWGV